MDLSRLEEPVLDSIRNDFSRIAREGSFTLGSELRSFEEEFAAYCGARECVGVSDGTNALRLVLQALGACPDTEVVTVPLTFIGTLEAIAMTGARPVLVDVDPSTRCMDPAALPAVVGADTAAVVPVHLYGRPAPIEPIVDACAGVPVVEDAAQAHGATLDGRRAGNLADAAAFSFYPTKNLGAMGDGGAVVCERADVADVVRSLRHHGCDLGDANRHLRPGTTARLDNLQAAILRHKLERVDEWNAQRRAAAERYRERLDGLPIELPPPDPHNGTQVYHLFVIELDRRDEVLDELRAMGIGAAVHYPTPAHLQPGWRELGHERGDFPVSEAIAARALSLPLFPGIEAKELDAVADSLKTAVERRL